MIEDISILSLDDYNSLETIKKWGSKAAVTDFASVTGAYSDIDVTKVVQEGPLKGNAGWIYTKTVTPMGHVVRMCVVPLGCSCNTRTAAIRPVLKISAMPPGERIIGYNGVEEIELGEYPQYAADGKIQKQLNSSVVHSNLQLTGRYFFIDKNDPTPDYDDRPFEPLACKEYLYDNKRYVRVQARLNYEQSVTLSNGIKYKDGDWVWIEVSPVRWLVDYETNTLISRRGLLGGIRFAQTEEWFDDFSKTELYQFLDRYMLFDLTQELVTVKKVNNPYGFNLKKVSEEDIIKGAIESGVAVFLHGPSSEGKSARVKQIDKNCITIYLRNATPESLNGKSVYNSETGEMIDIKPTWLKKLEMLCENEPDKLHIVFFDELTNALPSIQGIAFNIILDKEVNGIWNLPNNARIVAAGNEMNDSLAANKLAEPLFNRFAHVYIKTTPESWLKWAGENNIHPAICAYIAYRKGETLRSKYDGEKPNADPRKWEMASKMLYATNNPEMLRALVGEGITREFVTFCKEPIITLDAVLNDNYTDQNIESLNIASKYATVMNLSQVDEENVIKVRDFVKKLGLELVALFDNIWVRNDESRLEIIATTRIAEGRRL